VPSLSYSPQESHSAQRRTGGCFADEVDERGFFLYAELELESGLRRLEGVAHAGPELSPEDQDRQARVFWGGMSERDRIELLMRFSSFHFGLVALVSESLGERMRIAEGLTPEQAERRRMQMQRIVRALAR
jgi:hypothetical protein